MQERDKQDTLREFQRTSTTTTTAPLMVFEDDADLSVHNEVNHESCDMHFDQSNHGLSFINIHWASFSTGLSSVLAVLCLFTSYSSRDAAISAVGDSFNRELATPSFCAPSWQEPPRQLAPLSVPSQAPIPNLHPPFSVYPTPLQLRTIVLSSSQPSFPSAALLPTLWSATCQHLPPPPVASRVVPLPTLGPSPPSCPTWCLTFEDAACSSSASHLPSAPPVIEYQPEPPETQESTLSAAEFPPLRSVCTVRDFNHTASINAPSGSVHRVIVRF